MLAMLLLGAAAPHPAAPCSLIYPVAPDQAAARRIAEAVIAARPHPLRQRFVLRVMPDRDDPTQWVAVQMLPPPRGTRRRAPSMSRPVVAGSACGSIAARAPSASSSTKGEQARAARAAADEDGEEEP